MSQYPVRAGVFASTEKALQAVDDLHDVGFTWEQISVICSDQKQRELFPTQTQLGRTGNLDNSAIDAAATGALSLGGAAVAAILVTGPGMMIAVLGAFAGIAAAGTFTSLMITRGFESEATDFYEQAVQEGQILVAVEIPDHVPDAESRRELAAELLTAAGGNLQMLAH